jgi:hypothetical protein
LGGLFSQARDTLANEPNWDNHQAEAGGAAQQETDQQSDACGGTNNIEQDRRSEKEQQADQQAGTASQGSQAAQGALRDTAGIFPFEIGANHPKGEVQSGHTGYRKSDHHQAVSQGIEARPL